MTQNFFKENEVNCKFSWIVADNFDINILRIIFVSLEAIQ